MSINEITTPTPIATIEDRTGGSLLDLQVGIEPVQNLNGYDSPWILGANGNYFPPGVVASVTSNGVTVKSNGLGTYTFSGTSTAATTINIDLTESFVIPASTTHKFLMKNSFNSSSISFIFRNGSTQVDSWQCTPANRVAASYTAMANKTCDRIGFYFASGVTASGTCTPMFVLQSASSTMSFVPGSNICPITGFNEAKITRTGKNLLPNGSQTYNTVYTANGITFTRNSDGSITAVGTATSNTFYILCDSYTFKPGTYRLSGGLSSAAMISMRRGNTGGNQIAASTGSETANFTFTEDTAVGVIIRIENGATIDFTFKPMLRLADSEPGYEPYYGTTYPISFSSAGTVYSGTLDVDSGVLTVDKGFVTFNGTESWGQSSISTTSANLGLIRLWTTVSNSGTSTAITISNQLESYSSASWNVTKQCSLRSEIANRYEVAVYSSNYADAAAWKTHLTNNNLQAVYELATPQIYQLTSTQVSTILNQNNIWSDTGNIDYLKGGYTFHDKLTSPITQNDAINKINELVDDYKDVDNAGMMSFVDKTKLNNTNVFFGTCATAAGTAEKVVTLTNSTGFNLTPGTIIGVKFTYTNSATSVKLNVNNTGAKSLYQSNAVYTGKDQYITGTANMTSFYMYDGTYWVFLALSGYWGNTYDRTYLSNSGYTAKSAITGGNLIVADSTGTYFHLKSGSAFDITYPMLYAGSAANAGAVNNGGYLIIPFTVTTTQAITLTANKMVYVKGTLSGTTFTPVSTAPLTQTVPTSADNYYYYSVGKATTTTVMYLYPEHPIYVYKNGKFIEYVGYADTATTLQTARTIDGVSFNGSANISHFGTCTISGSAGTVSCTGFTLATGAWIAVYFPTSNSSSSSDPLMLNVNGTGGKPVRYYRGSDENIPANAHIFEINRTYLLVYDGTTNNQCYRLIGDLDTNTQTVTGVKGNAESSYRTGNVNLTPANIGAVALSGDQTVAGNKTFSGRIYTSFRNAVAMGSLECTAANIPDVCEQLRYSSGCCGSFNLTTAYTYGAVTLPTGWYNFLWIPHRSGGLNGSANGDNCNYGSLYLTGMNANWGRLWVLNYSGSAIKSLVDLTPINNVDNYLATHPERSTSTVIPFINNDIAFFKSIGGSYKVYYDGVEQSVNIDNVFDASASYWGSIDVSNITEIIIELTLASAFTYGGKIYVDFGNAGWRARYIKIEDALNNSSTWTTRGEVSSYPETYYIVKTQGSSTGIKQIRFTFKDFAGANFRISQIGYIRYNSPGLRNTSMSRGIDDRVYRSISPYTTGTYDLGSSTYKWRNIYGNLTGNVSGTATKATQDGSGNTITSTYADKAYKTVTPISNMTQGWSTTGSHTTASSRTGNLNLMSGNNITITRVYSQTEDEEAIKISASTGTTYYAGTSSELSAGTVTTTRVWSPSVLSGFLANNYASRIQLGNLISRIEELESDAGIELPTTFLTPTVTDSSMVISSGGYYTEGRHCFVQMRFKLASALNANSGRWIASGMPIPIGNTVNNVPSSVVAILSIAVNNRGGHNIRVNSDGRLQIVADVDHGITTSDDIDVTGVYTIAVSENSPSVPSAWLANDAKTALLTILEDLAYVNQDGQDDWNMLYDAFYPPAGLVSISAVYTQSGVVYDTDTLNSLKPDLVVTGLYDDQSTRPVTTYILSGTLTEGTSTITVSYGGMTTTFTVSVTHYDSSIYSWNLTQSLTDTKQGLAVSTNGTFVSGTGLSLDANNMYAGFGSYELNRTYEFTITALNRSNTTSYRRFFMTYKTNNTSTYGNGLIFSSNKGGVQFYTGSWQTAIITTSNIADLDGKWAIYTGNDGKWKVYRNGTYVGQSTTAIAKNSDHTDVFIGSSSADYTQVKITSFKIYEGEVIT